MSEIDLVEGDAPNKHADLARYWHKQVEAAEKAQKSWVERVKKIEKIYADERNSTSDRARRFNVLWSNVETIRPAVYMQTPKVKVKRRYRDRDPVARFASLLIERTVQVSCELYDFDGMMDAVVRDRLLGGRGQAWVIYDPEFVGDGDEAMVSYHNVISDYVPWQDYLEGVARTQSETPWRARTWYKTRKQLKEFLSDRGLDETAARRVQLDYSAEGSGDRDDGHKDQRDRCRVLEIWDKDSGKIIYFAPGSKDDAILGALPPPVKFSAFYPCPHPLLATVTSKSTIPVPDYALYQDQADELNRVTERIGLLQKALKVAGIYDAKAVEIADLLTAAENKMIPVEDWAMMMEGGGAKGRIEWYPVEQVAGVLEKLYLIRDQAKQTLYEVSGLGDILRGQTDPNETATAQGIKAKWGSLRIRRTQKAVQKFARDLLRMKAEVIAEQFPFPVILKMAGVDDELLEKYAPQPQLPAHVQQQLQAIGQQNPQMAQQAAQQAMQQAKMIARQQFLGEVEKLLRDDMARNFRIDVESDTTLEPDQVEEKQTAVEFVTAMSSFLKESAPMIQVGPEAAKMVGEILLYAVRRFDKVDQLEQVIEQAMEAAAKPRPPQPDPEMMKAKAQIEGKKAELKMKGEAQQQDMAFKRDMHEMDMGMRRQELQADMVERGIEMQQRQIEGEQKLSINARNAAFQRAQREGAPPE